MASIVSLEIVEIKVHLKSCYVQYSSLTQYCGLQLLCLSGETNHSIWILPILLVHSHTISPVLKDISSDSSEAVQNLANTVVPLRVWEFLKSKDSASMNPHGLNTNVFTRDCSQIQGL